MTTSWRWLKTDKLGGTSLLTYGPPEARTGLSKYVPEFKVRIQFLIKCAFFTAINETTQETFFFEVILFVKVPPK